MNPVAPYCWLHFDDGDMSTLEVTRNRRGVVVNLFFFLLLCI